MRTTYTILFFGPEAALIRLETRPCDDLQDAINYAMRQCAVCERIDIYGDNRTLWSGSPTDALAATSNTPSCGGSGASLH